VAVSRADEEIADEIVSGSETPTGARQIEGVPIRFVAVLDR